MTTNEDSRHGTAYWRIGHLIHEADLPFGPKALALSLLVHANRHGWCNPSHRTLAAELSVTERSVGKWQKILVDRGFLQVRSGGGRRQKNEYRLTFKNTEPDSEFDETNSERGSTNSERGSKKHRTKFGEKYQEKYQEKKSARTRFQVPRVEDVKTYAAERGASHFDAERFVDYYTANGWKVGRAAMKDWRAAVNNWIRNDKNSGTAAADPAAEAAWNELCRAVQTYSGIEPGKVKAAVCERTWAACQGIGGIRVIDAAGKRDLPALSVSFFKEWRTG
jgi:hypothetical protein